MLIAAFVLAAPTRAGYDEKSNLLGPSDRHAIRYVHEPAFVDEVPALLSAQRPVDRLWARPLLRRRLPQ